MNYGDKASALKTPFERAREKAVTYEAKCKVYMDEYKRLNDAFNEKGDLARLNVTKLLKRMGYKKNKDRFRTVTKIRPMDQTLKRMVMTYETISAQAAEWIRDALHQDDACVEEFFFSTIMAKPEAVGIIFESLLKNKSITKFSLCSCTFEERPSMTPETLRQPLFAALSMNTTLHTRSRLTPRIHSCAATR